MRPETIESHQGYAYVSGGYFIIRTDWPTADGDNNDKEIFGQGYQMRNVNHNNFNKRYYIVRV